MLSVLIALSASIAAEPVQLDCHLDSPGGRRAWILILDEAERGAFAATNPARGGAPGATAAALLLGGASEFTPGLTRLKSSRKPRSVPFNSKAKGSVHFPGLCAHS